jgi:hypothetical protein
MKLLFRCHLSSLDQNQMPGWHIKESYSYSRPQGPNKDGATHEDSSDMLQKRKTN